VDGAVTGAGKVVQATAGQVRKAQSGNIRNYAAVLGVGVVLLLTWFIIVRGVL
jgi:NADH-quinone oxidoreductase subunit L